MAGFLASFAASAQARTWHIEADGTGDAPTIQAAIDAAGPEDTVALAAGTYSWTSQGSSGDSMLRLKSQLTLIGEAGANNTILDGELRGRVIRAIDVQDTQLERLTVTRGLLRVAPPLGDGGGLLSSGASRLAISHCVFRENAALDGNVGGGLACEDLGSTVRDCDVIGNVAAYDGSGGGVYMTGGSIANCLIKGNHAQGDIPAGGGIDMLDGSISDCTIEGNYTNGWHSASGGGAFLARCTVTRCTFVGNSTYGLEWGRGRGGGVCCFDDVSFVNCVFVANVAVGTGIPGFGGAIAGLLHARVELTGCTLIRNRSENTSGSALDGVGGISIESTTETASVHATIIAWSTGLPCRGAIALSCSDVYGNSSGDGTCGSNQGGNFSADPQFCAVDPGTSANTLLQSDSPCAPGNHPAAAACELIGAEQVGCGSVSVRRRSWSDAKMPYR